MSPEIDRTQPSSAMSRITQAYRFALDPNPVQLRSLSSHAGAARFAWNWALAMCIDRYQDEGTWYSAPDLHRMWNQVKKVDPALAWWSENSKCAYQESFRDLDRALRDFLKSRNGQRRGKRLGFPKFKKRGKCKDSFRFSTGVIRCTGRSVTLPRLGTLATRESTRKLARRLEAGTARILSATVSRTAQRWFVSFTVEVERAIPTQHARPGTACGIDLGVTSLITGVDHAGRIIMLEGPRALRNSLRKLRKASRACSRRQKGSANRRRAAARLARIHARIANVRADALHKATTALARQYETVVVEDLNVTGMLASRRLARSIADQGFATARRMLDYKTVWNGSLLIVADRWYPSSKKCSACGIVKAKLSLAERTFTCQACGLALDRDINAARNLLDLAASGAERGNACRVQVSPGHAGHRTQPRRDSGRTQEPSIACLADTGTARAQARAAGWEFTP